MKRFINLVPIIVLIAGLIAVCGNKEEDRGKSAQSRPGVTPREYSGQAAHEIRIMEKQELNHEFPSLVEYGRDDPFNPVFDKIAKPKQETLTVNGIVWDKEHPMVIINNEIIGVGDKIDGNTVVEIKENSVILNDGMRDFELGLGQKINSIPRWKILGF